MYVIHRFPFEISKGVFGPRCKMGLSSNICVNRILTWCQNFQIPHGKMLTGTNFYFLFYEGDSKLSSSICGAPEGPILVDVMLLSVIFLVADNVNRYKFREDPLFVFEYMAQNQVWCCSSVWIFLLFSRRTARCWMLRIVKIHERL